MHGSANTASQVRTQEQERQLHFKKRHPKFRGTTGDRIPKKNYLQDFRQSSPTVAPSPLPSTVTPTIETTQEPSSPMTQPLCTFVDSPPLGSSGNTMIGRIGASFGPTTCDWPQLYPGFLGDLERWYEVIGPFVNPNADPTCTRVLVDRGTCVNSSGNTLVHVTAFTEFDPSDRGRGYLGSVGNTDDFFEFEFIVPGNQEFYIVGQQILDRIFAINNGEDCVFSVAVEIGTETCSLNTPTVAPTTAVPTQPVPDYCVLADSPPLGSSGTTIFGKIQEDFSGVTLDCSPDRMYRGTDDDGLERYYEVVGPFQNPSADPVCAWIQLYGLSSFDCVFDSSGPRVHLVAYTAFDEAEISQGYLGDVGFPSGNFAFRILVPGAGQFYVVGQQIRDILSGADDEGCVFSIGVEIGECSTLAEVP